MGIWNIVRRLIHYEWSIVKKTVKKNTILRIPHARKGLRSGVRRKEVMNTHFTGRAKAPIGRKKPWILSRATGAEKIVMI